MPVLTKVLGDLRVNGLFVATSLCLPQPKAVRAKAAGTGAPPDGDVNMDDADDGASSSSSSESGEEQESEEINNSTNTANTIL